MRGVITTFLIALLASSAISCAMLRGMSGRGSKANAVQALVTTTRSAVLLMTAAGIAYDAGAFGEPGSPRAEDTWRKISVESVRMGEALTAWSEAIKANRDASTYAAMVAQALAVIGALLPPRRVSEWQMPAIDATAGARLLLRPVVFLGGAA